MLNFEFRYVLHVLASSEANNKHVRQLQRRHNVYIRNQFVGQIFDCFRFRLLCLCIDCNRFYEERFTLDDLIHIIVVVDLIYFRNAH